VDLIRNKKIGASVYYSKPIHLLDYYQKMFGKYSLPKTEEAAKQVFSLPVHPGISETELIYMSKVVKETVHETR
jgi:perosamine synthetase